MFAALINLIRRFLQSGLHVVLLCGFVCGCLSLIGYSLSVYLDSCFGGFWLAFVDMICTLVIPFYNVKVSVSVLPFSS